eukprot:5615879-Pleurochrysis_carterae.AAC.2
MHTGTRARAHAHAETQAEASVHAHLRAHENAHAKANATNVRALAAVRPEGSNAQYARTSIVVLALMRKLRVGLRGERRIHTQQGRVNACTNFERMGFKLAQLTCYGAGGPQRE